MEAAATSSGIGTAAHARAGDAARAGGRLAGVRVFIYGINYAPEFTSTGRYTGEIGAALAREGARVDVVTAPPHYPGWRVRAPYRNFYSSERLDGVRVTRCPLFLAKSVRGVARLLAPLSFALTSLPVAAWKLVVGRPHVMFFVEPTLFPAPVAGALARLTGTRSILHVQDLEIDGAFEVGHLAGDGLLRKMALLFERVALKLFHRIVTISETMRQRLIEKGVPEEKVALVRNWVHLDRIGPLADRNAHRREMGVAEGLFVVQYSGNIGAKQALDVLCDAAERLRDKPGIFFLIAGDGPDRERLVERYGALPNLGFFDFQPEERLCAFLNMADLHVIPQLATNTDFALPSKLGGILASGRPVLVTAGPDQELSLFLGDAAIVTPPGDPERLAAAIRDFASSGEDGKEERRAALARQLSSEPALSNLMDEVARQARRRGWFPSKGPK